MRSKIMWIAGGAMISFMSAGVTVFILTQVIHKATVAATATVKSNAEQTSTQAKTEMPE